MHCWRRSLGGSCDILSQDMGRDTFEKVSNHKIDDVSQPSNVVGIVVPNDVGLSSKNGGQ